jgi:FkbM family methyltransferase
VLNTISGLIQDRIPKGLKHSFYLVDLLSKKNVTIKAKKTSIEFAYPVNNESFKFQLKRNSSDSKVFEQIIILEEYKFLCELIKKNKITVSSIIDAGANIGLTTIYLKQCFTDAKVILIEPEHDTFIRLVNNIELNKISNTIKLNKGLWFENTTLYFDRSFRDKEDWSVRLSKEKKSENSISTVTINELMLTENLEYIDLLKIDIEGAEKELFLVEREKLGWLKKTKILALEIHDEINVRAEIEALLREFNFELCYSGELTIGINKDLNA